MAGNSRVINSTNSQAIIGTVIDEANNGKIDLNGFTSFWSFIKQDINATLGGVEINLKPTISSCKRTNNQSIGLNCSPCVCEYR